MKPLRLLFADDSWQYDGNTPENRPLGGAHSSLVYLTRALAELGHDVHVFNNCTAPGPFNGVHYHQLAELTATNKFIYSDAFISLRSPRVFRAWINAGVRILWSGDAIDQPVLGNYLKTNEDVRQNIDCIFCKSRWQAWTFMKYFKWPADKTFVTRNAIWPEYFSTEFYEPPDNRLVYTSTPFRGLKLLLTLFPRIIRSVPDAELHVFSSMQVYQHSKEEDRKKYGHIYQLAEQPGVIMHGSVGQRTLAKKLTRCRILAYPNTFPETSCLSVMEAIAAGCAVVTSWLAALPETVGRGGVLVQGIPGSDEYNEAFVEQCVRLLKDRPFWRRTAKAGKEWILNHYTWDKVAVEWSEQINKLLQQNKRKLADIAGWPLPSHQKEIKKIACTDHKNVQKESAVKPLRLVFADNSWAYEDTTPEQAPLGGAHSSLIYLTRALAALGHDVHVYNHCNSPGEFHGVYYHKFQELDKENKFFPADAFIALRNPTFFSNWLNAAVRILWTGDAIDQPNLQILRTQSDIRQNIDYIICKSQWQAWTFMNYLNWPTEKLKVTRNAVWPEYFPKEFPEPQGRRLVYTSTPFRGLELLLRLFPKIYQALPDTRLHVFSSMEVYQQSKEVDQKQYGHIYRLAEQPGVIMHGSVGQRQLTAELTKCKVLAYPNIFPETCCTAAMEALAAGCAVVTSQLACMAETVGPGGVLISGIPGTDEYNDSFVENCIRLLTDHTFWRETASAGRDWILNYFTWDKVAKDWSAQLNQFQLKSQKKVDSVKGWHPKKDSKTNKNRDLIKSVSRKKTPTWQPLNLVFADDSWPYDGNTPANSPLDGPHSALVYLTKELAALGHEVHVYNNCLHAGIYQGVHYHRFDELAMANNYIYADAFIGLRNPWLFMNWLNAGVRILWAQDNFDQPHLQALKTNEDVRKNIDTIFCVTRWQAGNFLRHFHWDPEKMIVTRNGVCPHFFPKEFTEPKNNRLVYTSAPYRGLELLLKLFPEIYQATPTAELHVFSSLQIYQQSKEEDEKAYGHIYKLGKQPGVVMHGAIGQKELARELVQSKVLAYPNSYLEPSSIAVMEALAGGCAVVTSNLAALPETVGPGGVLIAGIPDTADYNDAFVENCVRLLKDHTFWGKTALAGRAWLLEHNTWKKVALEWSGQISNLIHQTKTKMDNLTGWKSAVSWLD